MGIAAELFNHRQEEEKEEQEAEQKTKKISKLDEKTSIAADKILEEGVLGGQLRLIADASAAEAETVVETKPAPKSSPSISGAIENFLSENNGNEVSEK